MLLWAQSRSRTTRSPHWTEQVRAAETAFAKTLADRDLAAFRRFLAPMRCSSRTAPLRGPEAIVAGLAGLL